MFSDICNVRIKHLQIWGLLLINSFLMICRGGGSGFKHGHKQKYYQTTCCETINASTVIFINLSRDLGKNQGTLCFYLLFFVFFN